MNKTYQGTVKAFNGQFGFLKSELGDTYFHKSGIVGNISLNKGDEVEFKTEPSLKKEGSLQCCEVTLIKKFEKPIIQQVNPILGIIKWFNDEKGFGIITTPEKNDYFFHKSNFKSIFPSPKTGDVLVFEKKKEKGKKVAFNCKTAKDYEDLKNVLEYLFKDDNVIIEVKVIGRGYRGKIHYTTQNRNISLLKQAVFQILKDKMIDDRLNFISDCFRDKLADKPSEEQLKYFNLIKTIFENNLKNDKTIILSSFFNRHTEFLIPHTELSYFLWLEGYIQEKDLSYIAQQITKESIGSYQNTLKKIFEKLTDTNEQETVLKEFLEIIGSIDNEKKYGRIKHLASLSELDDKLKDNFLSIVFNECNIHYQVKLFLDYLQFREGDKQNQIIKLFNNLDITSFYSFCLELLNPLEKINTYYYYNQYSYLKIYLEKKNYIIETNNKYGNSSIFSYKEVLLNESHFETKIAFFRTISSFIEGNLEFAEQGLASH